MWSGCLLHVGWPGTTAMLWASLMKRARIIQTSTCALGHAYPGRSSGRNSRRLGRVRSFAKLKRRLPMLILTSQRARRQDGTLGAKARYLGTHSPSQLLANDARNGAPGVFVSSRQL